ncbi:ImmA/IrrE family metallo-endopeptidase [Paenibacillus sp. P32E]|uniref:ImmA/IrrE family metallo-endopeptidase n=1 Tax=Paenibacillus sp. P32E TaxID=1349434 RepID=UPI00093B274F|nr:ImmA/IrrE family metallo-endopeptidase [Paenibacillus sp. P32E]OKP94781.1 hypothetical protein A3848_02065 [Paenibacillus sp. P32E]
MFEELLIEAESAGIEVRSHTFRNPKLKGLYIDGVITLNSSSIHTITEKQCILAEEIGHHHKTFGIILDQKNINHLKQEISGNKWAYQRLVPFSSFISAFKAGIRNRFEFAEYLGVTEHFLDKAITYYLERYGISHRFNHDYIISFDPLGVIMMFE